MRTQSPILRSLYLQWFLAHLFPRLRHWPVEEWPEVIDKASKQDFNSQEILGIGAAVAFVAWVLAPVVSPDNSLFANYLWQLLLAFPCLLIIAGPFFVRRIRRGIDELAEARR